MRRTDAGSSDAKSGGHASRQTVRGRQIAPRQFLGYLEFFFKEFRCGMVGSMAQYPQSNICIHVHFSTVLFLATPSIRCATISFHVLYNRYAVSKGLTARFHQCINEKGSL